jgi:hypothetical protein
MSESTTILAVVKGKWAVPEAHPNYLAVQQVVAKTVAYPACIVTLVDPTYEVLLNEIKTGQYTQLVILDEREIVDTIEEAKQLVKAMKQNGTLLVIPGAHTDPVIIEWAMEKKGRYSDDFPALLAADKERRSQQ